MKIQLSYRDGYQWIEVSLDGYGKFHGDTFLTSNVTFTVAGYGLTQLLGGYGHPTYEHSKVAKRALNSLFSQFDN